MPDQPDRPKSLTAKRAAHRQANRLARVRAAVDTDDQGVTHLLAAYDFWRAMCKKLPSQERETHRRRVAELLTNDALELLDPASTPINFTRLELAS